MLFAQMMLLDSSAHSEALLGHHRSFMSLSFYLLSHNEHSIFPGALNNFLTDSNEALSHLAMSILRRLCVNNTIIVQEGKVIKIY